MPVLVRRAVLAAVLALLALAVVDGGSVLLTRLTVPDDVRDAGQQAAAVVADRREPVLSRQTATAALAAARSQGDEHHLEIAAESFVVYPDDRVDLTGTRTAPTFLLKRLPGLGQLLEVSSTLSVEPLAVDSSATDPGRLR